jgi:hypothetical protein
MGKCSTLIYSIDNLAEPSEKLIDIGQFFNEMDVDLKQIFRGIELNVNTNLVQKTLALIKDMQ